MNTRKNTKVVDFEDTIFGFLLCCVYVERRRRESHGESRDIYRDYAVQTQVKAKVQTNLFLLKKITKLFCGFKAVHWESRGMYKENKEIILGSNLLQKKKKVELKIDVFFKKKYFGRG